METLKKNVEYLYNIVIELGGVKFVLKSYAWHLNQRIVQ